MIVVKLQGGLGNQLFQYAIGRSLSLHFKTSFYLDKSHLLDRTPTNDYVFRDYDLDLFNLKNIQFYDSEIKKKFWRKNWLNNLLFDPPIYYTENRFNFDNKIFEHNKRNIYLDGYWQSFKYFEKFETTLRKELTFKNQLTSIQKTLMNKIKNSNSVCVNFRRTDFVELDSANKTHGITPVEFYTKCLKIIKEKTKEKLNLYIFSDDIEWCKKKFFSDDEIHFIDHEPYKGDRFSTYMELMSYCKYFIIPNSTFTWWAAWISNVNGNNIYVPYEWFNDKILQSQTSDLIPKTWNRVEI